MILTVLDEELDAIRAEFGATQEIGDTGSWTVPGAKGPDYPLVVAQTIDKSNLPAYEDARTLIEFWHPEYFLLVGVAGGITRLRDGILEGPSPGDVVCVRYVHYAETTKRVKGNRHLRYISLAQPAGHLLSHVRVIRRTPWSAQLEEPRPDGTTTEPSVHEGEVVALEFLAGDAGAEEQRDAFELYDHAIAVESESAGVARAVDWARESVHYNPVWMGIRGISDRSAASLEAQREIGVDNNVERELWRCYAAAAAARFARKMVNRLVARDLEAHEGDDGALKWQFA